MLKAYVLAGALILSSSWDKLISIFDSDHIKAKSISIVDDKGNETIYLGQNTSGDPLLLIKSPDSDRKLFVAVEKENLTLTGVIGDKMLEMNA